MKAVIAVGAVVVAVAAIAGIYGPGLYADWANEATQKAPTLETSTLPLPNPEDVAGLWTTTDGSFAGYRVNEVLRGHDVIVTGRTEKVTGSVTIADGAVTAAEIVVDMASVETTEAARDAYFRNSIMDVDTFPTATFILTQPAPIEAGATSMALTGDLTIHGVTQSITIEAALAGGAPNSEIVQVTGNAPITFADFGIQAPSLGFVKVEEKGSIEFSSSSQAKRIRSCRCRPHWHVAIDQLLDDTNHRQ